MERMNRAHFLRIAGGVVGVGVVTAVGCGGDDNKAGTGGSAGTGGTGGGGGGSAVCDAHAPGVTIASNHGHMLVVSAADAKSGQEKTYSIKGTSTHDHQVILAADDFKDLETGTTIIVDSSDTNGHTHTITVVCA